ncbi:hypothetical protein AAG570_013778 [Ranatra chinensis]|uniref:Uncharacterized protein n=1 Tax=Ranatra chinensis TaxID=642074 RepID=A0ABD0YDU9_9HEMI
MFYQNKKQETTEIDPDVACPALTVWWLALLPALDPGAGLGPGTLALWDLAAGRPRRLEPGGVEAATPAPPDSPPPLDTQMEADLALLWWASINSRSHILITED